MVVIIVAHGHWVGLLVAPSFFISFFYISLHGVFWYQITLQPFVLTPTGKCSPHPTSRKLLFQQMEIITTVQNAELWSPVPKNTSTTHSIRA